MTHFWGNSKVHSEVGKRELEKEMLAEGHVVLIAREGDVLVKETILGKHPIAEDRAIKNSIVSYEGEVREGKEEGGNAR